LPKQTEVLNRIRRLRFDAGEMTQQELADRVRVTRQTIIALEAGAYAPSLLLAFRIAGAFGVALDEVFQYAPEAAGESRPEAGTAPTSDAGVAGQP
jgi:putative transcriptional regulator